MPVDAHGLRLDGSRTDELARALDGFREDVNANEFISQITRGWDSDMIVEPLDGAGGYRLLIRDGKIESVSFQQATNPENDTITRVRGKKDDLIDIFQGKLNAIRASNEGRLQVFGEIQDQAKLDAIALILWGT